MCLKTILMLQNFYEIFIKQKKTYGRKEDIYPTEKYAFSVMKIDIFTLLQESSSLVYFFGARNNSLFFNETKSLKILRLNKKSYS